MKRTRERGLTLVELIVAFTIMLILTAMSVPLARAKVRAERERELRHALTDMRYAIDRYKDLADAGKDQKVFLLRRIPRDPFTGKPDWGLRSDQDDPQSDSWGGQNVFDVYSKTNDRAPDGTRYAEW